MRKFTINLGIRSSTVIARTIATAILLTPFVSYALGLGKMRVDSGLGEPLLLQIQLESVTAVEAETLDVSLASRSDFARAGVEYPDIAPLLGFELVADPDGQYRVVVTTEDGVQEPYLHILVSATWSGGKAVREYTALLDPPLYSGNPAPAVQVTGSDEENDDEVASEIAAAVAAAEAAGNTTPDGSDSSASTSRSAGSDADTIRVGKGDTLSDIVNNLAKPAGVDHFRALEAIYRKNPEAFIDNNMNLLRSGVTLKVPTFEEMQNVSRRESLASFASQLEKFNDYRNVVRQQTEEESTETLNALIDQADEPAVEPLESISPDTLGASEEAPLATRNAASDDAADTDANTAVAESDAPDAQLTIGQQVIDSDSVAGAESEAQIEALRSQLAELDESLLASGVESEGVRQNLKQIQDQVERISTLIEIEDTNLATAQSRAGDSEVADTLNEAAEQAAQDAETQDLVSSVVAGSAEQALTGVDSGTDADTSAVAETLSGAANQAENDTAGLNAANDLVAATDGSNDEIGAGDEDTGGGDEVADTLSSASDQASLDAATSSAEQSLIAANTPTDDSGFSTADPAVDTEIDPDAVDPEATVEAELSNEVEESQPAAPVAADDDTQTAELATAQLVDTANDGQTDAGAGDDVGDAADDEEVSGAGATVRQVADGGFLDTFKGLFSSLPEHALKVALGLLALIAGLFLWQRNKSQREYNESMLDIETEEVSMNSEASIQNMSNVSGIDLASANDSALELTIGGGMSYLSEEGIAGVNEEDNEVIKAGAVDPLAEADVYLAYDRDEQAIQVLKEAFADAPERGELAEKLLEIYHKQDDRRSFDALATEMSRRLENTHNFSWDKVVAMGREVSPDNALYQGDGGGVSGSVAAAAAAGAAAGVAAVSASDIDEHSGLDLDELTEEVEDLKDDLAETDRKIDALTEESGLDINQLNMIEDASENSAVRGLEVDDLDFDIESELGKDEKATDIDAPTLSQIISENVEGKLSLDEAIATADESDDDVESVDDEEIKLDLDIDEKLDDAVAATDSDDEDEEQDSGIDAMSGMSELSEASMSKLEPYHESETALELAKAYLELGEQEIAKGFIEEVLTEGSDKQKGKARKLIKELAS